MKKLLATLLIGALAASANAANVCTDPANDVAGNPGGGILDLLSIDATNDATNLQLTLSVNGDIGATNWGKYVFFIDTAAGGGGTQYPDAAPPTNNANPWVRNIAISDPNRAAEFWLGSWVDGGGNNQLWNFTGVGSPQWNNGGGVAMVITPGAVSTIQYTIPLASLGVGVGQKIYLEGFSSGGGDFDTANDSCNNPAQDIIWDGSNWSQQAAAANSGSYTIVPEPVSISLLGLGALALIRRKR